MVKTANEGKDNESSFYRFQVKNSLQIPIAFFCGVKTENEGYQIIWKKGSGSNDTQQIVPEILESLQFPDNELLTETFQTACQEQKRALEAENNSDGVKKQKGKKTVTCISPVNVRTEQRQHKPGYRSSDDRGRSGNARKRERMVQDFV